MSKFLTSATVIVACRLGAAWPLMVLIGVIHHTWIPALPAVGYWTAVLTELLLLAVNAFIATGAAITNQLLFGGEKPKTLPRRTPVEPLDEWSHLFPRGTTRPWHIGPKL